MFFVLTACTGDVATNHNSDKAAAIQDEATSTLLTGPLPEPEVMNENYQTVILKGDIPSPQKRTSGKIDDVAVSIIYGSPSVRGRTIWGGLEPYGKVWRTGANEATIFQISEDMKVEGETLAAGRYALFTIPNKDTWSVIFNTAYDQWGAFEYDEAKDALRVETKPMPLQEKKEALDFIIDGNTIAMQWNNIHLPFKLTK